MASPDEFAIPHTVLRHFDLSSTPWTEGASADIDGRRQKLPGGRLFFDRLLAFAELEGAALYPPRAPAALRRLLHAIYASPPDRLKRDCFFYYLLKDYDAAKQVNGHAEPEPGMDVDGDGDVFNGPQAGVTTVAAGGRAEAFAKKRCMPRTWRVFIDGYWALDHGKWELAVASLSDPSITEINFISEILHTLATHVSPRSHACALVNSFLSTTHPQLNSSADNDIRLIALASAATLSQAFTYIRAQSPEEQARMREAVWSWALGAPRTPCGAGTHGVQSTTLREMLHLPLTAEEDKHLIDFLSHPPRTVSPPALSLLHDLVTLRLIHQGQYQQSLQLDKQLAGSGGKEEDRQRRREMVREFIAILPEAHRRALLVDVEALAKKDEGKVPALNGHAEDVDMGSSWTQVDSPIPPPIASEPAAPSFATIAAPPPAPAAAVPTQAPSPVPPLAPESRLPQSSSSNSLFSLARNPPLPSSPAPASASPRPPAHQSPFAGPPRFALGTPAAPSPRRVLSGSPFNLPPSTAAARASQTPVPLPKAPKQIINDDHEEDEGSVLGRRGTKGKGKGRSLRESSLARSTTDKPSHREEESQERLEYREPPSSSLRRSTRRHVSGTSQAHEESERQPTPPSTPPSKRPESSSARQNGATTTTTVTMPGAFDRSEPTIDEEQSQAQAQSHSHGEHANANAMPPPPPSMSRSRTTRANSAVPDSARTRSRFTRSASRAILDEDAEHGTGTGPGGQDRPPAKKPKSTTTTAATGTGTGRRRRTSAASEITDDGGIRRSTRRGTTAQPSEQGSPTPSVASRSEAGGRRRTARQGSATPRMSTRSRKV